jgi:GEVED domain/Secretion system C-terminal sorting domain/Lectin C-type domain/HYR domain
VSYNVIATDNCSATVSVSPASGSIFGQGTTTVNATATDPSGNTANCSFTVTVNSTATVSIVCPDDIIASCAPGGAVVTWNTPTATISGGCGSGNGCPTNPVCYPGFTFLGDFNGSRYYVSNNGGSWNQANSNAQGIGGELITINSAAENTQVKNWLNSTAVYWTGYNDALVEGSFVWSSGSSSSYTNWAAGEPNNSGGYQDFAVLNASSGLWYDRDEKDCNLYVVEINCGSAGGNNGNVTVTQIGGPASGSSFPVGTTTITYVASNGLGATDTCSFTVTVEEVFEVLCPGDMTFACEYDPKKGKYDLGATVSWNEPDVLFESCASTACDPKFDPKDFTWIGEYNGHQYYLSDYAADWEYANNEAGYYGGSLVTIDNAAENAWLDTKIGSFNVWTGLTDRAIEGSFVWESGTALGYTNYVAGQPDNANGSSCGSTYLNQPDFVAFNGGNGGKWSDFRGCRSHRYVMELACVSVDMQQTAGPKNGDFLAPGTYTVSYLATTSNGDSASCSFTVTVEACPLVYCDAGGNNSCYEWIRRVNLTNVDNNTGNDGGYEDYTYLSATVSSGTNYPIILRPGFSGGSYTEFWRVYVDWNQDGDFDDANEMEYQGSGTGTLNGTISVPAGATLGNTRMRVMMRRGSYPAGPCCYYAYGEVEDYTISVNGTNSRIDLVQGGAQAADEAGAGLALISVYPVPTDRDLNLNFTSVVEGRVTVQVMDMNGKVMMESVHAVNANENLIRLDVASLPMATYLVKVSNGSESFVKSFVKQ